MLNPIEEILTQINVVPHLAWINGLQLVNPNRMQGKPKIKFGLLN
jgi:hypothetical protein